MKPVRPSDRGPAVEDIQRRLLALGYELGPTGVDGVFLGATASAVSSFQQEHHLAEDGFVADETWSALVDAGFTLGDRMLYLRMPHFHGADVRILQQALSVLGFACGAVDGIFGAFSERAVREFQLNSGLPADGIAGPETARTIMNLRHVWEGKDPQSHSAAHIAPARAAEVLTRVRLVIVGDDEAGARVSERLVNLAHASAQDALIHVLAADETVAPGVVTLRLCGTGSARVVRGRPVVSMAAPELLAPRLVTALAAASECHEVVVEVGESAAANEREDQRAAVLLLDAVCVAFD
jgi:peptidoglycan hydrolase-like protein with peptidoglycan-binding domain